MDVLVIIVQFIKIIIEYKLINRVAIKVDKSESIVTHRIEHRTRVLCISSSITEEDDNVKDDEE